MRTNYVLIDLENVKPTSFELLNHDHFRVIVFVGSNQAKVSFDFADSLRDRLARQAARTMDQTHATIAQRARFTGRHETPRAFVQERPHRMEFRSQFAKYAHARAT